MQINEKEVDGLKHSFEVIVPSKIIEAKVDERLQEVGKNLKIPGFRPGKIPLLILKQRYDGDVRKEVLEKLISSNAQEILQKKKLATATSPRFEIKKYEKGSDLTFTVDIETLPEIEPADLAKLSFEGLKVTITPEMVDEALEKIAKDHKRTQPVKKARKARKHDTLIIDFKGWQGNKLIPKGQAENFHLELGSGSLIPGFEDQLIGASVGDKIQVKVTFPSNYPEKALADKPARFEVTVKEHLEPAGVKIDDELAKDYNFSDLNALRTDIQKRLETEYSHSASLLTKRAILDKLASLHDFPVPQDMVKNEFEMIWQQAQHQFDQGESADTNKENTKELKEQEEMFKAIAERRIRLGLLLAEIGRKNNITVSQAEIQKALTREVMKYGSHAKEAFEYYRKNPEAQAQIHAPLYEDKVIAFILQTAKFSEREVSLEEFNKELEKLEEGVN